MGRYDSQSGVINQEKMKKLNIAVIGTQTLTHYVLTAFSGLGVGNIHLFNDNQPVREGEFLFFGKNPTNKLLSLELIIKKINPGLKISRHDTVQSGALSEVSNLDMIIDLTNNPDSKGISLQYALNKNISFISAASEEFTGSLEVYNKDISKIRSQKEVDKFRMLKYNGKSQGVITSSVIAGLVAEEFRKICLPAVLDNTNIISPVYYNLHSSERFNDMEDNNTRISYENKKILIVGAGSLGTFAGISLVLSAGNRGNTLTIIDPDIVEKHNLNRQIFYFDAVDKTKAEYLADRLKNINPNVNISGKCAKVAVGLTDSEKERGVSFISEEEIKQYDLIIGCIDSEITRKILNEFAVRNKIPYIDGASGMQINENQSHYETSKVTVYIPGKSICQSCQKDLEHVIHDRKNLCLQPALVMPNMIGGAMEAAEAAIVLSGFNDYKGTFNYLSKETDRLRFLPFDYRLSIKCYLNCH